MAEKKLRPTLGASDFEDLGINQFLDTCRDCDNRTDKASVRRVVSDPAFKSAIHGYAQRALAYADQWREGDLDPVQTHVDELEDRRFDYARRKLGELAQFEGLDLLAQVKLSILRTIEDEALERQGGAEVLEQDDIDEAWWVWTLNQKFMQASQRDRLFVCKGTGKVHTGAEIALQIKQYLNAVGWESFSRFPPVMREPTIMKEYCGNVSKWRQNNTLVFNDLNILDVPALRTKVLKKVRRNSAFSFMNPKTYMGA